jgi:hypothetical protein
MKKLWLDDERPAPDGWVVAKTAGQAVMFLATNAFSEVSLDHDLGNDALYGTGYDVACWLEEKAYTDSSFRIPLVHVHTQNASARKKMLLATQSIEKARLKKLEERSS